MSKIAKTNEAWREQLSPESYYVTREHGTERAFTSSLNDEKRDGIFSCLCCGKDLFSSETKYDSGSGWPSFYGPVAPEVVGTSTDRKLLMTRTEVHCADCDAHLGHVFPDGPRPTGLRYCINGAALKFEKKDEGL